MAVKVKICGVTTIGDAIMVANLGADMIGFNFYKPSPRYIEPEAAQRICEQLVTEFGEKRPRFVGVFVNATVDQITNIMRIVGLDMAQLSGDESVSVLAEMRGMAYKGIRPSSQQIALEDVNAFAQYAPKNEAFPSLLLDAYHPSLYGGTGMTASTEVAEAVKSRTSRLMLAGGLTPENVNERVRATIPWGVDVASGVEDNVPGKKSPNKVQAFIDAVESVSFE